MRIEVNQSNAEPWGRLSVEDTKLAASRLSGDGFRSWVLLALNQDGFVWCGDLEPRAFQELLDHNYLIQLQEGNYLFRPDGDAGGIDTPAEWDKIAELYGSSGQQDLNYVRTKLESVCLDDRIEDILSYWAEKYRTLQELDHHKARSHFKFDFAVLLVWWLWDNFRFQPGDELEVGPDAKLLRFHDTAFKDKTQRESRNRQMTVAHIQDSNCKYWNTAFAEKKFEISLESVGKILKQRKGVKYCENNSRN